MSLRLKVVFSESLRTEDSGQTPTSGPRFRLMPLIGFMAGIDDARAAIAHF